MGGQKKKSEKRIRKEEYWAKLQALTTEYKKAVLVDVDNVSSNQITLIRRGLRPLKAKMLMGKNVIHFSLSCRPLCKPQSLTR
jgi:ribosomal protein L10